MGWAASVASDIEFGKVSEVDLYGKNVRKIHVQIICRALKKYTSKRFGW